MTNNNLTALYNKQILDLALLPPLPIALRPATLADTTLRSAEAQAVSRLCGSKISVALALDAQNRVRDYAQKIEACALGQAAAAIVGCEIDGCSADELHQVVADMRAMLASHNAPDAPRGRIWEGKWHALNLLESVRDYPNRHASTLLVFDAIEECLTRLGC